MSRRSGGSREQQHDARRRARAARHRVEWDRLAALEDPSLDAHDHVEDGPGLRPAPSPDELGGVLRALVEERGWGERLRGASLQAHWADVVGEDLAARCRPARLAGGTLVVVVASPQWATQLRFMTSKIAGRVSAALGSPVEEVRIVVGSLDE